VDAAETADERSTKLSVMFLIDDSAQKPLHEPMRNDNNAQRTLPASSARIIISSPDLAAANREVHK
jgi:hypothetical protein